MVLVSPTDKECEIGVGITFEVGKSFVELADGSPLADGDVGDLWRCCDRRDHCGRQEICQVG